jgi:hypothetical protein
MLLLFIILLALVTGISVIAVSPVIMRGRLRVLLNAAGIWWIVYCSLLMTSFLFSSWFGLGVSVVAIALLAVLLTVRDRYARVFDLLSMALLATVACHLTLGALDLVVSVRVYRSDWDLLRAAILHSFSAQGLTSLSLSLMLIALGVFAGWLLGRILSRPSRRKTNRGLSL